MKSKYKLDTRNLLFTQYIQHGRLKSDFLYLETLLTEINELISSTKNLYYENFAKNLNNVLLQRETYWSIIIKHFIMK